MILHLERAVEVMAEATSSFVQDPYATEALEALVAAGWTIIPPRAILDGARDLLLATGTALVPAREIRNLSTEAFGDVDDEELEVGARNLRALSYSCQQGATALERVRMGRS